ncbi:unnamed protein product [Protopolystoma xenopodis]|uniref:Uncharacterized protein n=1 Tax=Protopolystoma xenopodis TaxID=117903 RepID=A0A448WQG6_9PLAT|nr:unnamed protein product [Protopolystoma xenopodis]
MSPVGVISKVTTPTDQYNDQKKVVNLSSLSFDPETATLLKKELNFALQNDRSLLEDILVEGIYISDKFPEETKRDMEMKPIPRILTY